MCMCVFVCFQTAPAPCQRYVGCWGNCCPWQRLQPQCLLLLHGEYNIGGGGFEGADDCCMKIKTNPLSLFPANSDAPGLRQHEDVHAGDFGCSHHQCRLRPWALWHSRFTGGQQTWRPAGTQHHEVNQVSHTDLTVALVQDESGCNCFVLMQVGASNLPAGRTSGADPLCHH